jgi:hypothetical protein
MARVGGAVQQPISSRADTEGCYMLSLAHWGAIADTMAADYVARYEVLHVMLHSNTSVHQIHSRHPSHSLHARMLHMSLEYARVLAHSQAAG